MIQLMKEMKPKERVMALICALLVLGQIYFDLTMPDYMTDLTKLINIPGSTMREIWTTGLKMLSCVLASAVLCIVCGYLAAKVASGFSYTVREKLFGHVLELGQREMSALSIPSLINRTTNDITQIQMFVAMGLQVLIKSPIMAVWAVIKILGKSWELSVLTAGFVLVLVGSAATIICLVLPRFRRVQKLTDSINRTARENLSGISVVHAFNAEDYQNEKFDAVNKDLWKTQLFNQRLFALFMPIMQLGMNGLSLSIYWLGSVLLSQIALADAAARLTMFSNIIVFSTYAIYVVMSFMMMVMIFMLYPPAKISAGRITEVMKKTASVTEGTAHDGTSRGTLEFRDVSFRYPDAAEDQLSHVSFSAKEGDTVAFIGATGSGKTTLVNLIARFYDATAGKILLDGRDVRDYSFDALYEKIGYIPQKATLFSGTVAENVAFGADGAPLSDADIDRALRLAQATEFVAALPDGAASHIAQAGKNVSGGQKQRLSIARVLARKPELIIFDDSFSALDYRTDALLRAALARELSGTTCLIVAQRISTIRHADTIVVLDGGKAVGIGTHEALMDTCPVYREIAQSQLSPEELERKGA